MFGNASQENTSHLFYDRIPECHPLTPYGTRQPRRTTMNENKTIGTLADVLSLIDQTGLAGTRRRDMISAIKRICEMAGTTPECVFAGVPVLKEMLSRIRPA